MSRRQSAIIRIIAWSIAAIALIVVLILGMTRRLGISSFTSFGFSGYTYSNGDKYKAGGASIDADKVDELEIDWMSGDVHVEANDGSTVQFEEKNEKRLKENEKLHYYNDHGTLKIEFKKSERKFFSTGGFKKEKELIVRIPRKELDSISVDTVSADITVSGITAESLTIDTTSGDTKVDGKFQEIELDTVSGEFLAELLNCPEELKTDSVSGDLTVRIPDNEGFTYKKDSVSGSFNCDFNVNQKEDRGTYKNGDASFSFDTVSGDISIEKR